ncbi:MAG: CYTH domain-containing protein [Gammaproteobacteria bacterium]
MAIEVEHKFLLANERWRKEISRSETFIQGYLSSDAGCSIRIRICGERAWLNIKSATPGAQRLEFEYAIPVSDAQDIAQHLCRRPLIEKTRHFLVNDGHTWEIDEFSGDNQGLIVAEIELSETGEAFTKPEWLGAEVTDDLRYYNNNLVSHPYNRWKKS